MERTEVERGPNRPKKSFPLRFIEAGGGRRTPATDRGHYYSPTRECNYFKSIK